MNTENSAMLARGGQGGDAAAHAVAGELEAVPNHGRPDRFGRTAVPLRIEEMAAAGLLMGLFAITMANVLVRYFTSFSLAFTEEYSSVLMLILVLTAAAIGVARGNHTSVDILPGLLSDRARHVWEILCLTIVIALLGFVVYFGIHATALDYRYGTRTAALGNPQWLRTLWVPLLCFAILLRAVGRMARVVRALRAKPEVR